MSDAELIRGIKELPDDAQLTAAEIAALARNIDLILKKTLPAKARS